MARPIWSGALSFGLINVPVRMFSAVRDVDFHFRQLHGKDGAPIETRRFCSEEDKEVPYEAIVRGYDLDGEQVVLTDEDLATVAPRKTRTIDIEAFVDVADVDPIHFDHPYWLAPSGDTEGTRRAYQLLLKAMSSEERAALGRFVMRSKEYLVLIRPRDERLSLTTLLFHDEIRPAKGVPAGGKKPSKAQLEGAVGLIEAMAADWDPEEYHDRYRARLREVVKRKKQGKKIEPPKREKAPAAVPDLMAALEESLQRAKGGGGKRDDLDGLSREELYERAQDAGVSGRSQMSKKELIDALR